MPLDLAAAEFGGPGSAGSAPAVILHGLFGSGQNWRTIAQRLAEARQVFALDLRNHGASPHADAMGYADMAADVRAFVQRGGLGPVALIGHSMGGKVAMTLALTAPDMVERLAVVDVAPVAYRPTLLAYAQAMRAIDPAALDRRAAADPLLAPAVPDPAERAFLLQNLVAGPDRTLRWRLNLAAIESGMPAIAGWTDPAGAAPWPGPALFIGGERSGYLRVDRHAAVKRLFPGARIVMLPDAGHWVHAEQPEAFLGALIPFLDGRNAT